MNNFEGKELNIVQEAIWTEKEGFLSSIRRSWENTHVNTL